MPAWNSNFKWHKPPHVVLDVWKQAWHTTSKHQGSRNVLFSIVSSVLSDSIEFSMNFSDFISTFYLCSPTTWYSTPVGKVRDLLYDVTGCHPVTYADTRLTGQGEVPVERVLTNSHLGCCNVSLSFLVVFWIIVLHTWTSGAGNIMPLSNTMFTYCIYLY